MGKEVQEAQARVIRHVVDPIEVMEGAGVVVKRVLPSRLVPYDHIDPFLLLDFFDSSHPSFEGQAFPRHPHRGFEILTYLLSGESGHEDDVGNVTTIRAGGLQKITAGRGIVHGEGGGVSQDEPVRGLQLWINLALQDKKLEPSYQLLEPEDVPVQHRNGATVRVLVGEGSPIELHTPAGYWDVNLGPEAVWTHEILENHQGFLFLIEGEGAFGPDAAPGSAGQLLVLGPGASVSARASPAGVRFILAAGEPHREPVRWSGPFVD